MKVKILLALAAIFLFQFISSCDNSCGCIDPASYQVVYNGIAITPWNTSGFNATEVADTVYKNAFGLTLSVNFDQINTTASRASFGFSQAMACSCPDDEFLYTDPIDYAEILVTDVATNEKIDVSALFGTYGYSSELISLSELFEIRQEWHDGFQFELIDFEAIPNSAIFTVNVYLQSGIKFTEETQQINFYN